MRHVFVVLTLSFALVLSGCGVEPGPPNAHVPSVFTVSEPTFGIVDARWYAPSGPVDGYEIEYRIHSTDWQRVTAGLIPSGVHEKQVPLDPSVLERTDLGFRIRSVVGSSRSEWVNASVHHGISPPATVVASPAGDAGFATPIVVSWQNSSQVSTDLRLERAALDSTGDAGAFVDIPGVVFPSTTFLDPNELEGNWQYRVSYGTQGEWSTPISSNVATVILPPTGLVAHQIDGGVQLDWVPHSMIATSQLIERFDNCGPCPTQIATVELPADARTFVDQTQAPWPAVVYRVTAQTNWGAASSPFAVLGQVHVAGAFPLTGTALTTPLGSIVRTDQGLLHGIGAPYLTYYRDTGSGWDQFTPPGTPMHVGLFADLAGHPHALYVNDDDSPEISLVHAWHDGSAWRTETVPTPTGTAVTTQNSVRGVVAPSGTVHALTQHRDTSGVWVISHTVGAAGSFTSRDLVPSLIPPPPNAGQWLCDEDFAVASDETDWIAFACFSPDPFQTYYDLFRRRPDGTWTEELAPFVGDRAGVLVAAATGESAGLLGTGSSASQFHLRSAAGWGPTENVPVAGLPSAVALAPDGERVAVLIESPLTGFPPHPTPNPPPLQGGFGVWLSERTASGWTLVAVGGRYNAYDTRPQLSRTPLGRLVLVMPHEAPAPGLPNASMFVEDP